MISMRRAQLSFGDGLIAVEVEDLLEEWMKHAEEVLNDEQLVGTVYEALEHFPIRLAIARVCKESLALFFGNLLEERTDRLPKRLNSTRLHFA